MLMLGMPMYTYYVHVNLYLIYFHSMAFIYCHSKAAESLKDGPPNLTLSELVL